MGDQFTVMPPTSKHKKEMEISMTRVVFRTQFGSRWCSHRDNFQHPWLR